MADLADVDGVVVHAAAVDRLEWLDLQEAVRAQTARVTMPFCGCRGHLVTSSQRTHFFRHYSDSGCEYATGPESEEHIFSKHEIAAGARAAGAIAQIEAPSGRGASARWRADVLVTMNAQESAWEVQRSRALTSEYRRRHDRYLAANVDALWFIARDPGGVERLAGLVPAFTLRFGMRSAAVIELGELNRCEVSLREFVRRWLGGWRPAVPGLRTVANAVPSVEMAWLPPPKPAWVDPRGPTQLPQKDCPLGCAPGMSWSSIYSIWVCMTCTRIQAAAADPV